MPAINAYPPDSILKQFGLFDAPVQVFKLCALLGVRVIGWSYKDFDVSGQVVYKPGKSPTIYYNKVYSHYRYRFAIAHNLGHLALHIEGDVPVALPRDTDFKAHGNSKGARIEAQANGYAMNLLVPYDLLAYYGPDYLWDERALAALFGVSNSCMDQRINKYFERFV